MVEEPPEARPQHAEDEVFARGRQPFFGDSDDFLLHIIHRRLERRNPWSDIVRPKGGGNVTVVYPLVFSAEESGSLAIRHVVVQTEALEHFALATAMMKVFILAAATFPFCR